MPIRFVPLIFCCFFLMACSKLTQENYSKLQVGMTRGEVETLIGAPTECSSTLGMTSCTWGDAQRAVSVQFAGDKVLLYSGKGLK